MSYRQENLILILVSIIFVMCFLFEEDIAHADEALFEVKNSQGDVIFAVYPNGIQVLNENGELIMSAADDSIRFFTREGDSLRVPRRSFSVGAAGSARSPESNMFMINTEGMWITDEEGQTIMSAKNDNIRFYVREGDSLRVPRRSFSVGAAGSARTLENNIFDLDPSGMNLNGGAAFNLAGTGDVDANFEVFGPDGIGGNRTGEISSMFILSPDTTISDYIDDERMLWYPIKSAFRVGHVLIESPDSVGFNSTATGYKSKAIGDYSQAMGRECISRGLNAAAFGSYSLAQGNNSFAAGSNARALQDETFAVGTNVLVSGPNAFAVGLDASALGNSSVAIGAEAEANQDFDVAVGPATLANGPVSLAVGPLVQATNQYAIGLGVQAQATGVVSLAIGDSAIAEGNYSTALGPMSRADGYIGMALGHRAVASEYAAIALGYYAFANNHGAIALGTGSIASGLNAVALGPETVASGMASVAMGTRASTDGKKGSFIFADYPWLDTPPPPDTLKVTADNQFMVRASGGTIFYSDPDATQGVILEPGGGSWENLSDRNLKENFQDEDNAEILRKIENMPIQSWNFKAQDPNIRHIGPTAQDFHTAFQLGTGNTTINSSDIDGINMLAIQALIEENQQLKSQLEALETKVNQLQSTLQTTNEK